MTIQEIVQEGLVFGEVAKFGGLGVIPLCVDRCPDLPSLDTLEQALEKGAVRISEIGEAGEVQYLLFQNEGDQAVMVLDGEEIEGGKQNRIVNTTLIILAHQTVKIPVSCIEAGRWHEQDRADFQSGQAIFRAKSRAAQKASVTANVRAGNGYRSNQHAVWDQVAESLDALRVRSGTANFREARARVADQIDEFVNAFRPAHNQIGSIFMNRHRILGVEMVATPALFSEVCDKVTRSFAFEALDVADLNGISMDSVKHWWDKILIAKYSSHKSPAVGEDIRISTEELTGSGLVWNNVLVHLSCFGSIRQRSQRPQTGRASVRLRWRNLRSKIQ